MNESQREQVRDNAKYLRQVRPIDPAEIYEYIEGTPHPGVVRQVLREEAVALSLTERDDGTFEPATDEPISTPFHGVEALPEEYSRPVEDLLVERFGPGWPDEASGEQLRSRIREFKQRYLTGEAVTYDEVTALGYALYHLPAYFAATQYVLADLIRDGLLPGHLRVLDIGAGVGGPALGLDSLVLEETLVEYHAIEPSAGADVLSTVLEATGPNFHPTVHRQTVESFDPTAIHNPGEENGSNTDRTDEKASATATDADAGGDDDGDGEKESSGFDLILMANVLSELSDPAAVLGEALSWLAPDGTLSAIAPADRNTAIQLRSLEREVEREAGATVYAPTVRLWPNETPENESWSFRRHPDIEVPSFQRQLDEGERTRTERRAADSQSQSQPQRGNQDETRTQDQRTSQTNRQTESTGRGDEDTSASAVQPAGSGEFVNVDVQYAYSHLRRDGKTAVDVRADRRRVAKLKETEEHVTDRVDVLVLKLSHDLAEGENPLYLVGDGSETVDHFAVVTKQDALNRGLVDAAYGEPLLIENILVLWNDDEEAYNLVVDGETVVERIRP